jgi:hypothetical protein
MIRGTEEDRTKFDLFLSRHNEKNPEQENISPLMSFIPAPFYYLDQDGYNNGGYEWCVENWGTKWPESSIYREDSSEGIELEFSSPWGPPVEGYKKISEFLPGSMIYHAYYEEGMDFYGCAVYSRGELLFESDSLISESIGEIDFDDYDEFYDLLSNLISDLQAKMLEDFPPYIPAN